ncbi:MAG: hypothetical protein RQ724_08815 [Desulfuromonadales bacterium]|nr:hypothetical protein [Desulfuromonadales bacterium]
MIRYLFASLLVSLLTLSGCQNDGGSQPSPATTSALRSVSGTVVAPVEGTTIYVYKKGMDLYGPAFTLSEATGADGSFDLKLPAGDYILVARKRQTGDATGPVLAGDNKSEFINLSVSKDVTRLSILAPLKVGDTRRLTEDTLVTRTGISGTIFNSDRLPVEAARVHVYDHVQMSERPKFVSEKTGPDGRYLIYLPEGGTYYLAARDKFGGPPKLGDLYGRYDQGTIEPSAVIVKDEELLKNVDITVHKVW